jgi:hypothetical protein
MGETRELGRRVELLPMDQHFHNISIALYLQRSAAGPAFLVQSYSRRAGAQDRLEFIARTMATLGGLDQIAGEPLKLRFPCGAEHLLACRRLFLEACKPSAGQSVEPRALEILDKKSSRTISVVSKGTGHYLITADGGDVDKAGRIAAIANGLVKLGELQPGPATSDRVTFACGHPHDALVGLLLVRALNVRAILREEEMTASRGILAAPSAQR